MGFHSFRDSHSSGLSFLISARFYQIFGHHPGSRNLLTNMSDIVQDTSKKENKENLDWCQQLPPEPRGDLPGKLRGGIGKCEKSSSRVRYRNTEAFSREQQSRVG
ncbi:hypothetical protein ElyMa_002154000 [Elysia marginata]|uniref:Uncharacterized protein n=1 Tax=Elysia marginata TaxID=1093978 RepID=A0AAV4FLX8_9GAST|nr:hypothetical protein ElyMa_002154000 [Elysia marginata]